MVKLNGFYRRNIERIFKKYNIPTDVVDIEALWDSSLTWQENKTVLLPIIKGLSNSIKKDEETHQEDEEEHLEQQMNLQEQNHTLEQFEKAIENIKATSTPELDKYFKPIKELVKITVKGKNNGLVLVSNGGLGKTINVLSTLNELNLKPNQDYIYLNSYITALELYNLLYSNKEKIIFLDDVEKVLDDLTKISILKACMWESAKDMRVVSYYSSTEKLKAPLTFEFRGKLILALNKIPNKNREIIESLLSRAITYRIDFSYKELIEIFYELAKVFNIDFKVVDYIKENTDEATENLNFRTLIQASMVYDYYKENPDVLNGHAWKEIVGDMLVKKINPFKKEVLELMNSKLTPKEQVQEFIRKTGRCRATYYNYKNELSKSLKSNQYDSLD